MAKRSLRELVAREEPSEDGSAPPEVSRTLIEVVYTQLREDIVGGRLEPGTRLRVEHLKDQYGASAGTLREAITRLVSDALVEAEGQRGFRVTEANLEDLEQITELRLHIELDALRRSIRFGDQAWRERVSAAFEALSAVEQPLEPGRSKQWETLNTRFHEALISATRNPWTLRILRLLARHGERYRRYAIGMGGQRRDVHAEHLEIFEAAMRGQEARAALALEAHIRATPELLLRAWREMQADELTPSGL